ncbi:MAG: class B sortase [Eubacterium sp.]|nr:class B sortase [Eubacterium sp.]
MRFKRIRKIMLAACFLVFIGSGLILCMLFLSSGGNVEQFRIKSKEAGMENPIDFDKLQKINPDIYAWVQVPGTSIDYPVASSQGKEKEDYYLNHNFRKAYEFAGTIYSQRENSRDFSDPVTILYGHNMINGSMFAGLRKFADEQFFGKHDTVYIFTPEQRLTYQIAAYYETDNKNILQHYGFFQKKEQIEEYLKTIRQPDNGNVRLGISLNAAEKILTLSTCSSISTRRRILQSVLVGQNEWEESSPQPNTK